MNVSNWHIFALRQNHFWRPVRLTWPYQLYSNMMMRQVNELCQTSNNFKLCSGTVISLPAFSFQPVGTSVGISQPSGLHTQSTHPCTHVQPGWSFALLSLRSVDNEPEPIILSQWIERNRARNENHRANYFSLMYNLLSLTPTTLCLLSLSSLLFINYSA